MSSFNAENAETLQHARLQALNFFSNDPKGDGGRRTFGISSTFFQTIYMRDIAPIGSFISLK